MRPLQSKSGSINIGEAFIKDRSFGINDKNSKVLIKNANSVDILSIFREYNIRLDEYNKKTHCLFSFHKERSASFTFYKDTNSFYCFGCKNGGGPVEFVSLIENLTKEEAAQKIINKFELGSEADFANPADFVNRQQLFLEFSTLIRDFISNNLDDKQAVAYCEKLSLIFDTINSKHQLDNDGLKSLIDKLKIKLNLYK